MTNQRQERRQRFYHVDLYPVTCEPLSLGRRDEDVLRAAAAGGAKIIQLRDKHTDDNSFLAKAAVFRRLTTVFGMLLIINDRLETALSINADGVHLGQNDLPVSEARRRAPDLLIGVSCHRPGEPQRAELDGADYFNIGPLFATRTKDGAGRGLGPDTIGQLGTECHLPFTVMGGIKANHIPDLLTRGARRIAMVTGLTQAPDIRRRVQELRGMWPHD